MSPDHSTNPVIHTEISRIYVHSTLYRTLKKFYLPKAEIPTFKKLVDYYQYIEPNEDLFREMQSLLDILDSYRKTETVKNEQKMQFMQDRLEKQHADVYFKQKILQHAKELLRIELEALERSTDNEATSKSHQPSEFTRLNHFLDTLKNPRWRNIIRDIYATSASAEVETSSAIPVQRMETPRSEMDSRLSESSASSTASYSHRDISSSMGLPTQHRRIFMTDADELDLDLVKDQLNVQFLMQDSEESKQLLKQIRDALLFERQLLESDVDYIRQVLEDESEFNYKAAHFILPSSQELNEIEQYLSDLMEQKRLQQKMDRMTSGKRAKMITPKKKKLPSRTISGTVGSQQQKTASEDDSTKSDVLKSHVDDSNFQFLLNKESVVESAEDRPADPVQNTASGTKKSKLAPRRRSNSKSDKPSSFLHRVQQRSTSSGMKDTKTKELSSFLSGDQTSKTKKKRRSSISSETQKRLSRPSSAASRLRKTVLSNRTVS